jgi:hypothetical protein
MRAVDHPIGSPSLGMAGLRQKRIAHLHVPGNFAIAPKSAGTGDAVAFAGFAIDETPGLTPDDRKKPQR